MIQLCEVTNFKPKKVLTDSFFETLITLDFFHFVPDQVLPEICKTILHSGDIFPDEVLRSFALDTENVYEQGACALFSSSSAVLKARKITVPHYQEVCSPDNYQVTMEGKCYQIITPSLKIAGDYWLNATLNTLELLSDLLSKADYGENIYFDPAAGNDGTVFLLTTPLFKCLTNAGILRI